MMGVLIEKKLSLQSYQGEKSGMVPFNPGVVCGYISKHVTTVLKNLQKEWMGHIVSHS